MRLPSGENWGEPVYPRSNLVSCCGFEPSASHVQISVTPVRMEENTSLDPSGEYDGLYSSLVEAATFAGAAGLERMGMRHIFESFVTRLYANRCPFIAVEGWEDPSCVNAICR